MGSAGAPFPVRGRVVPLQGWFQLEETVLVGQVWPARWPPLEVL